MGYNSGNSYTPYQNYLCHFGIKRRSGRYPYGSGERPFQGEPRGFLRRRSKKELKRVREREELAKRLQEDREKEVRRTFDNPSDKLNTLRDTSATELLMYRDELSVKELDEAIRRIKMTRELRDISRREADEGWEAVNSVMRKIGYVNTWAKTGKDTFTVVESIIDALDKAGRKSK